MSSNHSLNSAKWVQNNEFYTLLSVIEAELRYYVHLFRGKVVYCNCDDPYESNFFKYFALNFQHLGLAKLITTGYAGSRIAKGKVPSIIAITDMRDFNGNGSTDLEDVDVLLAEYPQTPLEGDGDFRSDECIALLKEADIVVTNPPFSLFREYVAQLVEHGKRFLIIGNLNAITYKEVFQHIKDGRLWLGYRNGAKTFLTPAGTETKMGNTCWFTNLPVIKRSTPLPLYRTYTPDLYPHYDNYNAINVDKVADIPMDWPHAMGVPITFLDKYCPEQFDIIGIDRRLTEALTGKVSRFYIDDNEIYARIIIQHKKAAK